MKHLRVEVAEHTTRLAAMGADNDDLRETLQKVSAGPCAALGAAMRSGPALDAHASRVSPSVLRLPIPMQEQQRHAQQTESLQRSFEIEKAAITKRFQSSVERVVSSYRCVPRGAGSCRGPSLVTPTLVGASPAMHPPLPTGLRSRVSRAAWPRPRT